MNNHLLYGVFSFVAATSLVACDDGAEEEKARQATLALETQLKSATTALASCDDTFAGFLLARSKEGLRPKERIGFIFDELGRSESCLEDVRETLEQSASLQLNLDSGKTPEDVIKTRMLRLQKESALTKAIDKEQSKWFPSQKTLVFDYEATRSRAQALFEEYKKAHKALEEEADPHWHSQLFWDEAPFQLSPRSAEKPDWTASGMSSTLAADFLKQLKAQTKSGKTFAKLVQFPLDYANGLESFESAAEFTPIYDGGVKLYIEGPLLNQSPEGLYADASGVAVGRGALWFECLNAPCSSTSQLKVTRINPQK